MKIAYCTPSLYLAGGVERVLTTKVNYLADVMGHDVTVILTDGADQQPFYKLSPRVHTVQLNIGFEQMWNKSLLQRAWIYVTGMRRYRRELRRVLMELRADIVVSTMRREINFLCSIPDGSRKIGELHVTRSHYRNFEANENNPIKQWFSNRWSRQLLDKVRQLDAMVVLTPHELTQWPELSNVHCIPNPLPFPIATEAELPTATHDNNHGTVICVGRYSYQKGIDLLLSAWADVHALHPHWRLDIYGSGDREPYLRQARELSIDSNDTLRLLPASDNIRSAYLSSDIYALSSRFEGFGMVIIEAQACGLPVVAFDCPTGPRELIDNGRTGLLVPPDDVKSLSHALCQLIENPSLRHSMRPAALQAADRFSVANIMDKWERLFNEVH